MKCFFIFVVTLVIIEGSFGKVYDRCGLARALKEQGLPTSQLADWVCLVEAESSRNTSIRGRQNKNGSYDYGLFQINSRYWCKIGSRGGDCNANCNDFLDDDIRDDVKCAMKIYKRHGFNAWYGWKSKCRRNKPNLSSCGI